MLDDENVESTVDISQMSEITATKELSGYKTVSGNTQIAEGWRCA